MDYSIFYLPCWRDAYGMSLTTFYEELLETFRYADTHGFQRGLFTEHHFHYYGGAVPNPAVIFAAIARETKNLRLGATVSLMQLRNPLQVAEDYAMVDQLSGGRCDFSVARGFVPHEFAAFGIAQQEAAERIAEGLEICRKFWAGEPFAFFGKHFSFEEIEPWPPAVSGAIPIWTAASNNRDSFINAGRNGSRMMMNQYPMSFHALREKFSWYCDAWDESGRQRKDRKAMVSFIAHIAGTEEQAIAEAQQAVQEHVNIFGKVMRGENRDRNYLGDISLLTGMSATGQVADLFRERTLIGTAEQIAERIEKYRDLGFTEISILPRVTSINHAQCMETLQRFSEEVIPLVR